MRFRSVVRAGAPLLVLSMALVACGDDDDGSATTTTEAASEDTTTTAAAGENAELCALAEEIFEQEDFPTAEQIEKYTELAPPELEEAVSIAGPPIIAADGDPAAFFNAVAADEVEEAIFRGIEPWEIENCGIEHDPAYPEEANELDPDATRVDVTASEYTFEFEPQEIPAGPISFVMTNAGEEVHFMAFTRINEGHTLEEALAFEGDPDDAGITSPVEYDSGLAAPGGEDEEIATNDLEAGTYAMLCFIPGPDGTPHAFTGMAVPFTVT